MGIFNFRKPKKASIKKQEKTRPSVHINCDKNGIQINKDRLEFPTTYDRLIEILGEANRIEDFKNTSIKVYLWDDLGIYCSAPDPNNILMMMLIKDNSYDLGHQPKQNFTSTLIVDGNEVGDEFVFIPSERPYIIRGLVRESKLAAVAIGWNSKI